MLANLHVKLAYMHAFNTVVTEIFFKGMIHTHEPVIGTSSLAKEGFLKTPFGLQKD